MRAGTALLAMALTLLAGGAAASGASLALAPSDDETGAGSVTDGFPLVPDGGLLAVVPTLVFDSFEYRSAIEFDVSGLAGSTVVDAQLRASTSAWGSTGPGGAPLANLFGFLGTGTVTAADMLATADPLLSSPADLSGDVAITRFFDVTSFLEAALAGGAADVGFLFVPVVPDSGPRGYADLLSMEGTLRADVERPALLVDAVPEPSLAILLALGGAAAAASRRRRSRARAAAR
jgi:hypothetical protein